MVAKTMNPSQIALFAFEVQGQRERLAGKSREQSGRPGGRPAPGAKEQAPLQAAWRV